MAEAITKSYTLQHADGTEVTAQEAYDAFMSGNVIIDLGNRAFTALGITWVDNNGTNNDPNNVGYVELVTADKKIKIVVGDASLIR